MVVALSTALLGAAYRRGHYAGAGLCIAGLLVLVGTDGSGGGEGGGGASSPLLGDGLVLLGATLYALCNVLQEWLLGERGGGGQAAGWRAAVPGLLPLLVLGGPLLNRCAVAVLILPNSAGLGVEACHALRLCMILSPTADDHRLPARHAASPC